MLLSRGGISRDRAGPVSGCLCSLVSAGSLAGGARSTVSGMGWMSSSSLATTWGEVGFAGDTLEGGLFSVVVFSIRGDVVGRVISSASSSDRGVFVAGGALVVSFSFALDVYGSCQSS